MRLVEHFTSVSGHYISDQPDFDRFAEMLLLVEEAIGWIEDKPWKAQPSLGHNGWTQPWARVARQAQPESVPQQPASEAMQVFMQDLEQALTCGDAQRSL